MIMDSFGDLNDIIHNHYLYTLSNKRASGDHR